MKLKTTRRNVLKTLGGAGIVAASAPLIGAPAIAQARPLKVGILAPRSGALGTIGECGLHGARFAVEKINAAGGIGGRKVEIIVEEETSPKDTGERFTKLVLQEKVDCIQGIVSTGVSLSLAATAEEMKQILITWDGTTQNGVEETMPKVKYTFKSTDNECEVVMASLLAAKYFKGQFKTVAGINPDYSYGRNAWAAFIAILNRLGIEHKAVGDLWPKIGTMDLTSHVATLKAAKPDLIFSSMLFTDLPIFLKQAHAAGLFESSKMILSMGGFQHTLLKKEFTPQGSILGVNTLLFDWPNASPLQKEFVQYYHERTKDYPHSEADRAYFAMMLYKHGVETALKAKGRWPTTEEIAESMEGAQIEAMGGKAGMRKDHIADQTFYQGLTTHKNSYDFVSLDNVAVMYSDQLQKPPGADFWNWIKETKFTL